MSYAIFGLVFVLLIVFGVLSAKHWHWLNTVFLVLTFVAGVAASAGMAKAYKLRTTDMRNAIRNETDAEKFKAEADLAIYGEPTSISYDPGSLRGLNEQMTLEFFDRGRVWMSGTVTANGDNRTFVFSSARGDANDMNKLTGIELFVFADQTLEGDIVYPTAYIGSFLVASETAQQVELQPIVITDQALYEAPNTTWTMFEKMPPDSRDIFKKVAVGDKANFLGDNFDLDAYRTALMTQFLPAARVGLAADSKEYEQLIDRYAFDGMKLGDIENWLNGQNNRKNARFEPSPEETFVEFRFDKKVDSAFDVDGLGSLDASSRFQNGRAIDPALKAGKQIGFAKDDRVLIDQLTAEGYQRADGTPVEPFGSRYPATEVDRYYFRQLRDYPYMLTDLYRQSERLQGEFVRIESNNGVSKEAFDDTQTQIQIRDEIINGLDQDRQNLESDLETITELFQNRTAQYEEIKQRSRQLDQQIQSQYEQINGAGYSTISTGGRR